MKIPKIVFTGGPCGGKTTAIKVIAELLNKKGYSPILVKEAATAVKARGITPEKHGVIHFQYEIMLEQLENEGLACEKARFCMENHLKVFVILDRGLQDSAAYMDRYDFDYIQADLAITFERSILSYYAVIHLTTAANGAPEHYTLANNSARDEMPELAIEIDERLEKVWSTHPKHFIVENKGTFEDKLEKVSDIVLNLAKEFYN